MLREVVALVVLSLMVACGGNTPQNTATPYGQKILLTDSMILHGGSDTIRFGRMHEGEIAEKPLQLVNESSNPVVIRSVERSCGCTTLEHEDQPLKAGESRQMTLRFDARGEWGWQLKLIKLYLNTSSEPIRLYIEADIES